MTKYRVDIPYIVFFSYDVKADSVDHAVQKACVLREPAGVTTTMNTIKTKDGKTIRKLKINGHVVCGLPPNIKAWEVHTDDVEGIILIEKDD